MKLQITDYKLQILSALLVLAALPAVAQVASHAPTVIKPQVKAATAAGKADTRAGKPVARVNGAVLTELDLVREMYTIFPYARQHNGFPKAMEADIRRGALDMIIFEELVYQEAKRRNLAIPPARLAHAEAAYREQFPSEAAFRQSLQAEGIGSRAELREKIRRSLLIEALLKTDVEARAAVTAAAARAYYDKNPKKFEHGESFSIQTISFVPPENASADILADARRRAEAALPLAQATKSYQEFGRLAEQISDDDYHVNMGDHKTVDRAKLPPEVVKAARAMKPGEVSGLIQLGRAYTIFRLNVHTPAGKTSFAAVKAKLQSDLQKEKTVELRAALNQKLRKDASIEVP